ncbi:MAG: T9SS type A sorting domain-containing protein [candidate division KSB1 bacterium]|nr:T9SS type A sorting domain-containing protein [candidate division KSB1 bacterium]
MTGDLTINGVVYLRLRFDNDKIHFEASLDGVKWTNAYNETFGLPGYTPDTPFYYELAGFRTESSGVFTVDDFALSSTPSGAAKPGSLAGLSELLPTTLTLQNYPNPFHEATRFKISLPQNAEIRLAVFDMMGREVDDLLAGLQNGGNHEVMWSGRNRAGVYFVRLRYRLEGKAQWPQVVHRVMLVR